MIKVITCEFDHFIESYILKIENGDQINIRERDYDRIMIHESVTGKKYMAIVDEHEDEFEEPIEYLGFELLQ